MCPHPPQSLVTSNTLSAWITKLKVAWPAPTSFSSRDATNLPELVKGPLCKCVLKLRNRTDSLLQSLLPCDKYLATKIKEVIST